METSNYGAQGPAPITHEPIAHSGNQPLSEGYPGHGGGGGDYLPPSNAPGIGYGGTDRVGTGAAGTHGYETHGMHEPTGRTGATGTHGYETHGMHEHPTVTGTGLATGGGQLAPLPPTGTVNNQHQKRGGSGQKITGMMESAIGTLVSSDTLKNRGAQKQREADAIKLQGRELEEAERLEREAMMRRDRAVAHGAHPMNKNLGGGMNENAGNPLR